MNTSQVDRAGKILCENDFRGVFASDKFIQISLLQKGGYIFNTDPSSSPGEHWVGVWVGHQTVQYFDTFGRCVLDMHPQYSLVKHKVVHNTVVLQNKTTVACGHYSLIFIGLCQRGWTLQQIVDELISEPSSHIRDHQVVKIVEDVTKMSPNDKLGTNIHIPYNLGKYQQLFSTR